MATQKLNITRDQLVTFLENHELIKQFEKLIAIADEVAPSPDTQGATIQAGNAGAAATEALAQIIRLAQDTAIGIGNADQKAIQALDALGRVANALEMLATAPVIQNNNSVVTDYIDLPEVGPHITQARRVQWNQDDGTVDVGLYGGSVLQVGQEIMFYSKNTSGSLIPNGTPVMFTGTVGSSGKLTFGLAIADGSVPADYMMGVATQDIANNAFGYVTNFGLVRGFNTTGTPYGEIWADGDLLYFGAAAPGTWTKVQPIAPRIDVPVAVVVNAGSGGSGSIFVRMSVAESLARLQDVYIAGLADKDLLQYDLAQQRWENVPASTLPVGTAANLAGGAAGSVPYQSAPSTTTFRAIGTAGQVMRVNSGATAPEWVSPAALTKTDDTNVTLTLGGNPTNALLAAVSLTLGWTGQLSVTRGGTGVATSTGSGSNVLSNSPTFTGTVYNSSATGYALGDGSTWTPSGLNAIPNYGVGYLTTGSRVAVSSFGDLRFYVAQGLRFTINQSGQFVAPDVYNTTVGATNRDLFIDNTGLIGYVSSTRESKTEIADLVDTDWLLALKPRTYHRRKKSATGEYTNEFYDELEYGLIGDEAVNVNPELCFYDETANGKVLRGVHYSKLIVPLLRQIQKQDESIKTLTGEMNRLSDTLASLISNQTKEF